MYILKTKDNSVQDSKNRLEIVQSSDGNLITKDTLLNTMKEQHRRIDIEAYIRGKYTKNTSLNDIIINPKEYKNFIVQNRLLYLKENQSELLCILHIIINGQCPRTPNFRGTLNSCTLKLLQNSVVLTRSCLVEKFGKRHCQIL